LPGRKREGGREGGREIRESERARERERKRREREKKRGRECVSVCERENLKSQWPSTLTISRRSKEYV
jgi:hypothetical protein